MSEVLCDFLFASSWITIKLVLGLCNYGFPVVLSIRSVEDVCDTTRACACSCACAHSSPKQSFEAIARSAEKELITSASPSPARGLNSSLINYRAKETASSGVMVLFLACAVFLADCDVP
ncbi:hypothetical protein NOF04DRAFT_1310877 [Fusarium oxysporum II5]|nr:hypothetical protein NOF04DRAFT_1310877 [Fusarium oxysporum II5]